MHATTLTALGVEWSFTPWLPPQEGILGVLGPVTADYIAWRGQKRRLPSYVYVMAGDSEARVSRRIDSGSFIPGAYKTLFDELDAGILAHVEAFTYNPETEAVGAYMAKANDMKWTASRTADVVKECLFGSRYRSAGDGLSDEQNATVWNTAVDALITELTALKKEV